MVSRGRQGEMHGRLPEDVMNSDRIIAGSVRNPWDWYVSVWAYGCDGEGELRRRLAGPARLRGHGYRESLPMGVSNLLHELVRRRRPWRETYADSSSPALFRRWLAFLLDPCRNREPGEDYWRSPLSSFAGFYTYRYCRLFHRTEGHLYDGSVSGGEALREADERLNIVQCMIKMENITEGIFRLLEMAGIEPGEETAERIRIMGRTNPSSRKRDTAYYYDRATSDLVGERDAMIVDKYGYRPPVPTVTDR